MRIGLIVYGLDRPLTGIGRYTMELARALAVPGNGIELVLLTAGGIGPLAEERGLRCVSLPGCRLLPGLLTLGNGLIPVLARRLGLDVVHDPTGVTPFGLGAGGARRVVTIHDVFPWSCPGTSTLLDTFIYRRWLPRVLGSVDVVVADSRASRDDVVRFLEIPAERLRVIYASVAKTYRRARQSDITSVQRRYGLSGGYVLFVGSVEKRKNLPRLLEAFTLLRRMGEERKLVIVGVHRKPAAIMETLSKLALERHVIFTGYVPEEDLPAIYSGADLFVFPSLYEGFGLPPLEAMACGTPVVCSNVSSLPEVVGEAAVMADPYDVPALAKAMARVLMDAALREEMRAKGLERASQFTWERTARETVAVYRQVCNERP